MKPGRWARPAGLVLGCAAAVGLWFATAGQAAPARLWAITVTLLLPLLSVRQATAIDPSSLPRIPAYVSSIVSLWLIAAITATVARLGGVGPHELRLTPMPIAPLAAWVAGLTVAAVAILVLAKRIGVRESPVLIRLLPETPAEKNVFAGLSVTAGFCEELVFRGFLILVFTDSLGTAGAVGLSTVVFALSHAYQEPKGAARAGLLGLLLALPPVLSGCLWPSIIAHTVIDLLGGIFLRNRLVGNVA